MTESRTYSFHLTFADGSNPYYSFPTDETTHKAALRKWKRNYDLILDQRTESPSGSVLELYTATEKRPTVDLFTFPEMED